MFNEIKFKKIIIIISLLSCRLLHLLWTEDFHATQFLISLNFALQRGTSREPFGWEGVRLDLPEFPWLISCSIGTEHYLFKRF